MLFRSVVCLTATATAADRARSLAAGMDGYLAKPATMAELASTIDHFLLPQHRGERTAV